MNVKATIHLKSGGNISINLKNTSLPDAKEVFSEAMRKQIIAKDLPGATQLIPTDNIAVINLEVSNGN